MARVGKLNFGERKTLEGFSFTENSMPSGPGMFVVTPRILIQVLPLLLPKHLQMERRNLSSMFTKVVRSHVFALSLLITLDMAGGAPLEICVVRKVDRGV